MKHLLITGTLLSLLIWGCANPVNVEPIETESESVMTRAVPEGNNGDIIPGEYIVVFKEQNHADPRGKAREVLDKLGVDFSTSVKHVYSHAIQGFSGKIPDGRLNALRNHPLVDYVEPNRIVRIEPLLHIAGKPIKNTLPKQVIPWGIIRVNGGLVSSKKTLWILDTGIDGDHSDLNVDTERGYTVFVGVDGTTDDRNGHGTHVAGTAAAIDNAIGVIGVAPGTIVVPVKVLNSQGSGSIAGVTAGVDHVSVKATAGDVINMSLGAPSFPEWEDEIALKTAILNTADLGVMFAIAAGNDGDDASNYSPANIDHDNIYTVSAFKEGDIFSTFSNYGSPVDYAEPGENVLSLYKDNQMATGSGTSMAAPHMAGLLLLGDFKSDVDEYGDPVTVIGDPDENPIAVYGTEGGVTPPENVAPTASFTFYTVGLVVDVNAEGSSDEDGSIAGYSWDFGDGNSGSGVTTSHTYAEVGTYNVTLTVTDDKGATDSYLDKILIEEISDGNGETSVSIESVIGIKINKNKQRNTVSWFKEGISPVLIKRYVENVVVEIMADNSGSYTEVVPVANYSYQVCEEDGSGCSGIKDVVMQ